MYIPIDIPIELVELVKFVLPEIAFVVSAALISILLIILITRVRDKEHHKKLNRQLEKAADSFGNITDI